MKIIYTEHSWFTIGQIPVNTRFYYRSVFYDKVDTAYVRSTGSGSLYRDTNFAGRLLIFTPR